MKALRIFAFAAFLALGSAIAPQTASAYKYYITKPDGSQEMFEAENSAAAVNYFRNEYQGEGVLTKRPNGGGLLDFK